MERRDNPQKVKLYILVFAVVLLLVTVITGKSEELNTVNNPGQEEIALLEDYYKSLIEQKRANNQSGEDMIVKVISKDNTLVAKGMEDESKIKHLIGKSDFLIEIDGKRYYRLSYK